jgi:hypothetical protein
LQIYNKQLKINCITVQHTTIFHSEDKVPNQASMNRRAYVKPHPGVRGQGGELGPLASLKKKQTV